MDLATQDSVVYCDPPYAPLAAVSNFSAYTADGFGFESQLKLAHYAKNLTDRGIPVIISNHDTPFTRDLYSAAKIITFEVQRFISAKTNNRNKAAELIAVYG